ncbi:aminoacyl-tRNA deacylase [Microbacterium sp.]|uniref:aminoacyl-tRNA deacylase n=1 Tax=Microbacterium sp. TaxID=51671 RepID=UPI002732A38B|nr:YbaK/EbsC family protein [Microbacterium sp.]MDP3951122.1 YbaK/EbsC family protein [Microbacterium sp.]
MSETRAAAALAETGIDHVIVRHGPVDSLVEAALARGVVPNQVVKTLVVRRGEDDYLFILVPGDRQISWPKLRALLGVTRLSMPSAETARDVTGYERGTITPFGALRAWPVIADARVQGPISIGAGAHGVSALAAAADVIRSLSATVADVTAPQAVDDARRQ